MRRMILILVAALAAAIPIDAQTVEVTARGGSYYHLIVDGVEVSKHSEEKEAFQQAMNHLFASPHAVVYYWHDQIVDVTLEGAATVPPDSVLPPPDSLPGSTDPGEAFFFEAFDSGDLSNTMGGWSWGNTNRTQVVDWFGHGDANSLRFRFPGGEAGTDSFAEQRFQIGRNLTEYWLEFWVYFPDGQEDEEGAFPEGFSSAPFANRGGNNKLLRLWDTHYSHDNKHGASLWRSDTGQRWGFESTRSSGSVGLITRNPRIDPLISPDGPVRLGEWAQLRLHVRFSSNADDTADGGADGVVEFWVNGELVASRYDQPLHGDIAGQGNNSWVSVGYFMGWANSGFDEETYVFLAVIAFHDSNPGWAGS